MNYLPTATDMEKSIVLPDADYMLYEVLTELTNSIKLLTKVIGEKNK